MTEFSTLLICFTIYSFIGWVCETIFCSILVKKFVNRGFLNGPFCPIYGFGAIILQLTIYRLPHNIFLVFILGTLITTALEYFTALLLETLFHAKWWDYSDSKFNFQGRICLLNSCLFGVMSVLLIFVILPTTTGLVSTIPLTLRKIITIILIVYYLADIALTIKSMQLLNTRLKKISSAFSTIKDRFGLTDIYDNLTISERVDEFHEYVSDSKDKKLSDTAESIVDRIKALVSDNRFFQKRILKAFPHLRSTKYPEFLTIIKEKVLHNKK